MNNREIIKQIVGDERLRMIAKEEILDDLKKRKSIDHENLFFTKFKQEDDYDHIKCRIRSNNIIYNFNAAIKESKAFIQGEIEEEKKEDIYLLIVGNGLSRKLVQMEDGEDSFEISNLCDKAFKKTPYLHAFYNKLDTVEENYEERIGLLFDLIKYDPHLIDKEKLNREYNKFTNHILNKIFETSKRINMENYLPDFFNFLKRTKPHIATLNYDLFLYRFIVHFVKEENASRNERYKYTDGFTIKNDENSLEFSPKSLKRNLTKLNRFYLHLHGSCLFNSKNNKSEKKRYSDLAVYSDISPIVVLTSGNKKYSTVHENHSCSFILHAYNKTLELLLKKCNKLLIIGYGAKDLYLNEIISQNVLINKNSDIYFIETHQNNEKSFNSFKKFISETPLLESDAENIIKRMQFKFFNQINWDTF